MAIPVANRRNGQGTRFHFGSAVVPMRRAKSGNAKTIDKEMGIAFRALLGFHQLYFRLLLKGNLLVSDDVTQRGCSRQT